jgi:hypothetical protein
VALEGDHFALTTDFRPWCSISAMNRLGQTGADPASAACKDR